MHRRHVVLDPPAACYKTDTVVFKIKGGDRNVYHVPKFSQSLEMRPADLLLVMDCPRI